MARVKSTQEMVIKSRRKKATRWEVWHNPEHRRYEVRLWDGRSEGEVICTFTYNSYNVSPEVAYQHALVAATNGRKEYDTEY